MEQLGISVEEAAQSLGVNKSTLYRLIQAGEFIGSFRIGDRILVNPERLKGYVEEQIAEKERARAAEESRLKRLARMYEVGKAAAK